MTEATHAIVHDRRSIPSTSPRSRGAGITADISTTCRSTRGRPACSATSAEDGRRIARCISFLRDDADRQRLRAADRGPDRALRHRAQRGDRGHRPRRRRRCRRTARATCAEDQPRMRTDLKPISITQPEGPSFTVDGNLVEWQKWSVPHRRSTRTRGSCCTRSRYDDDGRVAPDPAPRVDHARWSCPTATPARCTAGRTRSTRASGASAA